MSNEPVYPSVKQGVLLVVVWAALNLFIGCVIGLAAGLFSVLLGFEIDDFVDTISASDAILTIIAVANILTLGGIFYYGFKKTKAPLQAILPMKPIRPLLYLPMMAMLIGMGILLSQLDNFVIALFEPILPETVFEIFVDIGFEPDANLWGFAALLIIVAPITEEPLFRGLLLRGFLTHRSRWKAVWISALLFGAIHMNLRQFLPGVALGVAFAWWRIETGSLLPAFLGHAFYNGIAAAYFAYAVLQNPDAPFETFETLQPLWLNAAGVVLLLLGIWSLRRLFQNPLNREPYSAETSPPK